MSLLSELKRRSVIRAALAYLAGAWLLLQIADIILPRIGFADAAITNLIIILAVGFLPSMAVAWYFELTPGGLIKDDQATDEERFTRHRLLDRVIVSALALAVIVLATDKFLLPKADPSVRDKSIAVLPFDNLSTDPEQRYFAHGISEELLNLLAGVEGLRVISRKSAFQFEDSDLSIPEIANRLHVAHVLEGSVRMSGNTIRITAQLIDAATDSHLWSKTYDRDLQDVFKIQDEVAAQVVQQIMIEMSIATPLATRRNIDVYPMYLQAKQLLDDLSRDNLDRAEQLLLQVIDMDPAFLDAKVLLATVYWHRAQDAGSLEEAQQHQATRTALLQEVAVVDPDNADANIGLAFDSKGDFVQAARYLERAFEREPRNREALNAAMLLLTRLGRYPAAQAIGEFLRKENPLYYLAHRNLAEVFVESGQLDLAEQAYATAVTLFPDALTAQWRYGIVLLFQGNADAALAQFEDKDKHAPNYRLQGIALALHDSGEAARAQAALGEFLAWMEAARASEGFSWDYGLARTYAWLGDADKAFHYLVKQTRQDVNLLTLDLDGPFFSKVKDDPRWHEYLASIGQAPEQLAMIEFDPHLPAEIEAVLSAGGK